MVVMCACIHKHANLNTLIESLNDSLGCDAREVMSVYTRAISNLLQVPERNVVSRSSSELQNPSSAGAFPRLSSCCVSSKWDYLCFASSRATPSSGHGHLGCGHGYLGMALAAEGKLVVGKVIAY